MAQAQLKRKARSARSDALGVDHERRTRRRRRPTPADGGPASIEPICLFWKRGLDLVAGSLLLVLAAPIVLLAACAVKMTSRGPAFYWQTRVGRGGRHYAIYKIRTMLHNCESLTGPRWSLPGDPRVTPIGHVLRVTHVDELPQLWNVVRGDMSLVGPRPERPEFVGPLEKALPGYRRRLRVRPGITGLAQIHLPADSDLASVRRKLEFDLHYVERVGTIMDLRVLLGTVSYLLKLPRGLTRLVVPGPKRSAGESTRPRRTSEARLRVAG